MFRLAGGAWYEDDQPSRIIEPLLCRFFFGNFRRGRARGADGAEGG